MQEFQPKHNIIVCVDSDGCVMDTMNIKHYECFGPIAVDVFQITDRERFLTIWNKVNLFSATRGTNRFNGLIFTLQEYGYNKDFSQLTQWVKTTNELSNGSLKREIEKNSSPDLLLALQWSEQVNSAIKNLTMENALFKNAGRSLAILKNFADIAVVSSANNEAIEKEWSEYDVLQYTDLVFGQNEGSKAHCLKLIKQLGYKKVLMVGDSPGDYSAAQKANTYFYPILFNFENESWDKLVLEAFGKLKFNLFDENYANELLQAFNQNLNQH
ncbi:HAD hydrolase-like protein [Lonepinella koalarum]|uniref:phosphoglycolate phosphatase n=1 Tax=Lonepinella koalarum TaxID=53417 RepID=A0A4R1KRK4_9PAST|nr:HAD hydrolase-like protein [Lonepinella koalarum]MDH2925616.1 haloacid dehalogenase [Lonepinella koalarum]TCK67190.1 phosphoglycolate phosphatase-like HAD superfamily hydrolase [Lonepinella koalarum]TFJ89152.1 HAD family hydrolase [Lonepinella koalarum]TYG35021.1 HAD hydrolase-like protein [Lonepinella koalarum]